MRSDSEVRRILVAIDFDATAESALSHAWAWTRHFGAMLTVLHISAEDSTDGSESQETIEALRALAERAASGGLTQPELLVKTGQAAQTIANTAVSMNADLIVLGSHRRAPAARWLLGSVTSAVLRLADRPVLLVKTPGTFFAGGTVVAAVDLSEASDAVVRQAARLAADSGAPLGLVYALPIGDHQSPGHVVMKETATHDLQQLRDRCVTTEVETRLHVAMRMAHPAKVIAHYAEEQRAQLLVVGGHGASNRGVIGNVTQAVLHDTDLPVLVVNQHETS
jgi:nucleotide-binding universal stress UspA family protein